MMRSLLDWYRSKKFKRAKDRWFKDRGDSTLRLDYPLDPSSIVFDVGGFRGDFAAQIHERYQCQIHVFEPVKQYYNEIKRSFSQKPQIKVHPFGLGAKNQEILINLQDDGSSFVKKNEGSSDMFQTEMENRLRYSKEWAHDGARNGKDPTSLHLRTKGEHLARTSDRARAGERRVRQAPDKVACRNEASEMVSFGEVSGV
jgi:hypothetical protein